MCAILNSERTDHKVLRTNKYLPQVSSTLLRASEDCWKRIGVSGDNITAVVTRFQPAALFDATESDTQHSALL
jgi:hypothetical protein